MDTPEDETATGRGRRRRRKQEARDTIDLHVRIDAPVARQLRAVADETDLSLNYHIDRALRAYLRRFESPDSD